MSTEILYLGVRGTVAALDPVSGRTLWQTRLVGKFNSAQFVTLLVRHGYVYAHTGGKAYCVDAKNGRILWCNELPGLGYGIASLAVEGSATTQDVLAAEHAAEAERSAAHSSDHGG
jgi:outer membrane protein assembly factor BamB